MKEGLVLFVIFAGLSLVYDMAKKEENGNCKDCCKIRKSCCYFKDREHDSLIEKYTGGVRQ